MNLPTTQELLKINTFIIMHIRETVAQKGFRVGAAIHGIDRKSAERLVNLSIIGAQDYAEKLSNSGLIFNCFSLEMCVKGGIISRDYLLAETSIASQGASNEGVAA